MNVPFTIEQFYKIFEQYNASVFPIQIIFLVFGILAVILIHGKKEKRNSLIAGYIGLVWMWTGIVYHISFFSSINKAAYFFGGLFILQGLFLCIELFRKRLEFHFTGQVREYIGYFFILYGLIFYPIISYLFKDSFATTISLGLPCPTTILTFGFLMLTNSRLPKYLLIIPTVWAIIGTGAAINFGVYQDYLMLISAIVADVYLIKRSRMKI